MKLNYSLLMLFITFLISSSGISQTNYSLNFDGDGDYVEIPDADILSPSSYTIELWVNQPELTTGRNTYVFKAGNPNEYCFMENPAPSGLYAYVNNSLFESTSHPITDQWTHIANTFDSATTTLEIFINGTSVGSQNVGTSAANTGGNLYLGWHPTDPSYNALTGIIDEIRISSGVRYSTNFSVPSTEFTNDANTIALFHLNEGSGTSITDASGNSNDGTINGATWSTDVPSITPPETNHSLSFDGMNDYVSIPTDSSLNPGTSDFSITGWLKTSGSSGIICSKSAGSGQQNPNECDWYIISLDAGRISFEITDGYSGPGDYIYLSGNSTINDNAWHYFSVVLNRDGLGQIFIDGVLDNSINISGISLDIFNDDPIEIGYDTNHITQYFQGNIDEICIWNIALSIADLNSYMNTELNGDENGLVGYWNLNEGSGTSIADASGNGNTGTIHGATWSTDAAPVSGSTTTTSNLTWSAQLKATLGSVNDNDNVLGVATTATNSFDNSFDEVEPPASPGSSISLYFPHAEWNNTLGDNFTKDIRPEVILTDTMQVWDFKVKSTDTGEVTLTFVFTDIATGLPVVLENIVSSVRTNISNNDTYTFSAIADSAHPFKISIGDTTAPTLSLSSSCTGPKVLIADSTHTLGWTTADGFIIDAETVYFSSDSGLTYTLVAELGTSITYDWTIPDVGLNYGGKVKIKSQDYAGNFREEESDYVFALADDSLFTTVSMGWNLWGAPIDPTNDTMTVNLNDDYSTYWTTYDFVNGGYTFDGILKYNEGYWLGALSAATIDVIGTPLDTDISMDLAQGWDLVSNPLVLDVSVDSLMFTSNSVTKTHAEALTAGWINSIYGYDGTGYVGATTFEPWKGYWIAVMEDSISMTYPIHKHTNGSTRNSRETGWRIAFESSIESANDMTAVIGTDQTASDDFDSQFDEVKPPIPPNPDYVSISMNHSDWEHPLGDEFAVDIRNEIPATENKEWIVSVESSEPQVTVSWTLENIPEDYEIGIDADGDGFFEDMRLVSNVTIASGSDFSILVGSSVLGADFEAAIPEIFALHQNYPNPFNPTTSIRFDLPEDALVRITVYDLLGRQIINLVNTDMTAGYRSALWNGTDTYGKPVSSGMYIYQIQAGSFVQSKKMVLLK